MCIERFAQLNQRPLHTSIYYVYKINAVWLCSNKLTFCRETGSTQPVSRRTTLVRSAGSTLASTFFFHLTTRLGRLFFKIDWNDLLQIVALVRHQALFEMIIDFTIASLNGVKTHMYATWTNSYKYTEFHCKRYLAFVAQSVRRWAVETAAGLTLAWTYFLHLRTRIGRLCFFLFNCWIFLVRIEDWFAQPRKLTTETSKTNHSRWTLIRRKAKPDATFRKIIRRGRKT